MKPASARGHHQRREGGGAAQPLTPTTELDFLHGSSSASLEGVLTKGLLPFGEIDRDEIPFGGEGWIGALHQEGINRTHTSVVPPSAFRCALEYAVSGLKGWTPALGQQLRDDAAVFDNLREEAFAVHQARLARWEQLSEEQRALVSMPFPVLYGIRFAGKSVAVRSDIDGECGIDAVPPSDLVVFVQAKDLETTQALVRALDSPAIVKAIDTLRENFPSVDGEIFERDLQWLSNEVRRHRLWSELTSDDGTVRQNAIRECCEWLEQAGIYREHVKTILGNFLYHRRNFGVGEDIRYIGEVGGRGAIEALHSVRGVSFTFFEEVPKAIEAIESRMEGGA